MKAQHSIGIIPILSSKLLERLAFYGMRSVIVLYMMESLNYSAENTFAFYKVFILGGVLALFGGLFGDLAFGSRRTAIIGGFMQAAGYLFLAVPNPVAMYASLFLILLGSGLYVPNLLVMTNLLYKENEAKLDSAMAMLYTAINVGAFLGAMVMGFIGKTLGHPFAFLLAGFLMIGSQLILLLSAPAFRNIPLSPNIQLPPDVKKEGDATRIVGFIFVMILTPIFWSVLDFSSDRTYQVTTAVQEALSITNGFEITHGISSIALIIGGILLALIWSFSRTSSYLKLMIGFVIYLLSFVIILQIRTVEPSGIDIVLLLSTVFLQAVGDLFIGPIALSIILRNGPQNLQGTLTGCYLALSSIIAFLSSYFAVHIPEFSNNAIFLFIIILLTILSGTFLGLYLIRKEK